MAAALQLYGGFAILVIAIILLIAILALLGHLIRAVRAMLGWGREAEQPSPSAHPPARSGSHVRRVRRAATRPENRPR